MKAVLNDVVVAEAPTADLVRIEGNWYFPPASLTEGVLVKSPTGYSCSWKGEAQYFTLSAGNQELVDGAWSYPNLPEGAVERIGTDFAGWIAFDRAVQITGG